MYNNFQLNLNTRPNSDDYLEHDYTEYYNYKDFGFGILTVFNNNSLVWNYHRSSDGISLDYFNFFIKKNSFK